MYGICILPVVPMRREPSHKSEMVSQLLFGEMYEITESNTEWHKILTKDDHYSGWIDKNQSYEPGETEIQRLQSIQPIITDPLICKVIQKNEAFEQASRILHLSMGSVVFGKEEFSTGFYHFSVEGTGIQTSGISSATEILHYAGRCLGMPYLWGGKSVMGFDCSGFVQVIYRMCGINLPRDASQQVLKGKHVTFENAQPGDLAFFGEEKKITHVGIVSDDSHIIHCSAKVRIDSLNKEGIIIEETNNLSHSLNCLRRVI